MSRNQAWLLMLALLLSYIVPLGVRPLLMPDEIYLSSFMVFGIGTTAVLDPMLVMWLTAALCAFWKAFGATGQRARFGSWSLIGALCGGAFLVKGFVALAVPVVAIAPLMLWH